MSLITVPNFLYPGKRTHALSNGLTLDAAEEHIAYILRAPKTGTLKKIGWRLYSATSPVMTLRVSIETVADAIGAPVATTDAAKTLYATGAVSADLTSFAAGVRFDAINSTTGISVTKGDLIAVVIRCTAYTSGSVVVVYDQYGSQNTSLVTNQAPRDVYTYAYVNGAGAQLYAPIITLEYDGEFVPVPFTAPAIPAGTAVNFNSSSNPDRRGLKFKIPYGCKLRGALLYADVDVDVDVILYDADEYTVMSGFPITVDKDKRAANTLGTIYVEFPTEPTLLADTWYRLVLLPKDTTNIQILKYVPPDDGAILGVSAYDEGTKIAYTTFNGAPSSGSHAWTDDATANCCIQVLVSQIDIGASTGGSSPRFGDRSGGKY